MKKLLFEIVYQILENQSLILEFLRDSSINNISINSANKQVMNIYELQKKLKEVNKE